MKVAPKVRDLLLKYAHRYLNYLIGNGLEPDSKSLNSFFEVLPKGPRLNVLTQRISSLPKRARQVFEKVKNSTEVIAEDISEEFEFGRSAAVQYLNQLVELKLVEKRRKGRNAVYYVPTGLLMNLSDGYIRF